MHKEPAEPDPDPAARALAFEQRAQRAEALLRKLRAGVMGHTTDMIWSEEFIVATEASSYFAAQREIDAVLQATGE